MVMSEEASEGLGVEKEQEAVPVSEAKETTSEVVGKKERVSDREKDLAQEASSAFNTGDYSACLTALEKLEILRPTDCVLAHNKIVSQCRAGGQVSLAEVVQQLEGLAKTCGYNLTETKGEDDGEGSVLLYNLAVAKFQLRHILQASQLASRLLPISSSLTPDFARKVLFLNCELSLALHQPELALSQAGQLESLLSSSETPELESESCRLLILKARCQVMARQTKSLKKELKSVSLPGPLGQTCEFVRAHIEALHGNHRKSIKMLNSCVQAAGSRVFPHYYNDLGCLHQVMRKPNLAIYYFKNALDRLEGSGGEGGGGGGGRVPCHQDSTSWLTQSQVLYNIGVSLLHARRPSIAFDILLEVVGAHYLDPHVWYHLAECCLIAGQTDNEHNLTPSRAREVADGGVGVGQSHKLVAANPASPVLGGTDNTSGLVPSLSLEFAYVCLKNAESLLPGSGEAEASGVFCEGVGYIGNPITWAEVEQLRVAVLAAKAYTALSLGDFIPAGQYAEELLTRGSNLPGSYTMLAHLYAAESLILQDRLSEAMEHLDPDKVITDLDMGTGEKPVNWYPNNVESAKTAVQYNLAVGFALRDELEKASSVASQLYKDGSDVPVQVLLLVLYLSLRQGQVDKARRIVRERCPASTRPPDVTGQ